ncbi:hypothetical protein K435DRAFT_492323 [Dendrothele bispora CBS 962.96]|uniref:Uncharacterized protein n=1 Tax=Dendrothele bispora (strain CBS 962.96) TaxID=1314807 RepID=A0A4S8KXS1_DENBC|nr:hypothetical protein K435DRAFT_492323 [Dendrothele bispora CBS 962.96]
MNLAGSSSKDKKYKALRHRIKDLVGSTNVPYGIPWKDIPEKTKSTLFEAARQDQPFLVPTKMTGLPTLGSNFCNSLEFH